MKVNDPNSAALSALTKPQGLTSVGHGKKARGGGSDGDQDDQVSLSNLGAALSANQSDSPQYAAYLGQLSASVSAGGYQVDSRALSGSIIDSHLRA